MSSLIRFFDHELSLICGIIIDDNVGTDLVKWIHSHPCPSVSHICCVYRLYSRHKYGRHMTLMHERPYHNKIAWKYDIYMKNNQLIIKFKDYVLRTKAKLVKI